MADACRAKPVRMSPVIMSIPLHDFKDSTSIVLFGGIDRNIQRQNASGKLYLPARQITDSIDHLHPVRHSRHEYPFPDQKWHP